MTNDLGGGNSGWKLVLDLVRDGLCQAIYVPDMQYKKRPLDQTRLRTSNDEDNLVISSPTL